MVTPTLMSFLLDRARLEIQYSAAVGWFLRRELLPNLLDVIRVDVVEETSTVPLVLGVVQHRCHRVGHVDYTTRITASLFGKKKEKTIIINFV